ncbi:MAG TPA: HAD family hydrolase [Candidatus Barnesiella excrementavium]|nr:HAD family hydrolase [Candidatus Barnesiella excrementavium]
MKPKHDIKGILFNFSGTIDTEGCEWFDLIWRKYRETGIPVSKSDYLHAHEYAEAQIAEKGLIEPHFNSYQTLYTKLSLQIRYLTDKGLLSDNSCTHKYPQQLATLCYNRAIMHVKQNEQTLEKLGARYRLGIVAQSYGNMPAVLVDYGLSPYFTDVIESSEVNLNKPDQELFRLSVDALHLAPEETLCVSNSLNNDLRPAQGIGCPTVWLNRRPVSSTRQISHYRISSLNELNELLSS